MTAEASQSSRETSPRRSILKTSDSLSAASAVEAAAEPNESVTKRPHSAASNAVRVEICEHRNKLIFYRQDSGWRVGYFSEHRHRQARIQQQHHQQKQSVQIASTRRVTYPTSSGEGPSSPPSLASMSERSSSGVSRLTNQPRLLSASDLDISMRVIHACTNGCFAINS